MVKTRRVNERSTGKSGMGKGSSRTAVLATLLLTVCVSVTAGETERRQAKRMHDRLTGVPPSASVLSEMESQLPGNPVQAAYIAIDTSRNPDAKYFYNVTLKNFAAPWTNEEQSVFVPLNDYVATVIGMIRDDKSFNELLTASYMYRGAANLPGVAPWSNSSNAHYEELESSGVDLSDPANLVEVQQDVMAPAGIMTSRAAAKAFFSAGTNRAMFRFTMLNHLCNDLEQVKDTTRIPDRIRQDVSRSPGGDSRIFLNACIGCHAGMDPMAQAFAYYDYDEERGELVYTPGVVQPKYLINADNFKYGYVTADDHWENYWREGPNAVLGWGFGNGSGNGASSLGKELADSDAFSRCQVTKVFRTVCFGEPDNDQMNRLNVSFRTSYNMKQLFAETAVECMDN